MRPVLALFVAGTLAACGSGPAEAPTPSSVDRETFIATYVDLRTAAVKNDDGSIHPDQRARILEEHGVTGDELIAFVDANGENVPYMREVWDEVERRLDEIRLSSDRDLRR